MTVFNSIETKLNDLTGRQMGWGLGSYLFACSGYGFYKAYEAGLDPSKSCGVAFLTGMAGLAALPITGMFGVVAGDICSDVTAAIQQTRFELQSKKLRHMPDHRFPDNIKSMARVLGMATTLAGAIFLANDALDNVIAGAKDQTRPKRGPSIRLSYQQPILPDSKTVLYPG